MDRCGNNMKHLAANKSYEGYQTIAVKLDDLRWGDQSAREYIEKSAPAIFARQACIFSSIGKRGMENPIMVDSESKLVMGGCRIQYAVLLGYDSIDAIIVEDPVEVKRLQKEFVKSEYDLIPEKYIYKHILED